MTRGRLVGVDLGSRRIGLAVSDEDRTVATGVGVVARGADRAADHQALASVVAEYRAVGVVVGLPVSLSGEHGPAARRVLAEVEEMRASLPVDVHTVDERLTTAAASAALRRAGSSARRQRQVVDQTAAALILQTWMEVNRVD